MEKLKYKIGQEVKIKSLEWYNDNHDEYGDIDLGDTYFREYMSEYCGMTVTISEYNDLVLAITFAKMVVNICGQMI